MKKSIKSGGQYLTDGEFKPELFTKRQACLFAKNKMKQLARFGCSKFSVIEKDDYFCISIW